MVSLRSNTTWQLFLKPGQKTRYPPNWLGHSHGLFVLFNASFSRENIYNIIHFFHTDDTKWGPIRKRISKFRKKKASLKALLCLPLMPCSLFTTFLLAFSPGLYCAATSLACFKGCWSRLYSLSPFIHSFFCRISSEPPHFKLALTTKCKVNLEQVGKASRLKKYYRLMDKDYVEWRMDTNQKLFSPSYIPSCIIGTLPSLHSGFKSWVFWVNLS